MAKKPAQSVNPTVGNLLTELSRSAGERTRNIRRRRELIRAKIKDARQSDVNYKVHGAAVGERIAAVREELNLTQEDLAILCNVSRATVINWEGGKIDKMKLENFLAISTETGVTLDWLVIGGPATKYISELVEIWDTGGHEFRSTNIDAISLAKCISFVDEMLGKAAARVPAKLRAEFIVEACSTLNEKGEIDIKKISQMIISEVAGTSNS